MLDGGYGTDYIGADAYTGTFWWSVRVVRAIDALRDAQALEQAGNSARSWHQRQVAFVLVGEHKVLELLDELCRDCAYEMVACSDYGTMASHFEAMKFYAPDKAKQIMAEVFAKMAAAHSGLMVRNRLYKLACCFAHHSVVIKAFKEAGFVPTLHCSQRLPGYDKFPPNAVIVPASHLPKPMVKQAEIVTV